MAIAEISETVWCAKYIGRNLFFFQKSLKKRPTIFFNHTKIYAFHSETANKNLMKGTNQQKTTDSNKQSGDPGESQRGPRGSTKVNNGSLPRDVH